MEMPILETGCLALPAFKASNTTVTEKEFKDALHKCIGRILGDCPDK